MVLVCCNISAARSGNNTDRGHPHLLPHHSAAVLTDDLPDREKRNETTLLGALESS